MFKEKFKYYKSKISPPDFNTVLGFSSTVSLSSRVKRIKTSTLSKEEELHLKKAGLIPSHEWICCELLGCPGLLFVENPFLPHGQRLWARKALVEYPRPPSKMNLHNHGLLSPEEDWWRICNENAERKKEIYKQLRWVTLGYHHNWDTKVYCENEATEFPNELKEMCHAVGKLVGGWELRAEAAIINYYHVGSTLSGHTDHSEPNSSVPLLSFSFGQDAIFLIGGHKLEDDCEALLIRSGDIVIMSGGSRLSYHGVPLISQTPATPWLSDDQNNDLIPIYQYLGSSRININVRQVHY